MGIIEIFILVLLVVSALLLITVVMLQDEGGDNMGGLFGGGSSTAFGSRAGNILTKFTSVMAFIFMLSVISFAYLRTTKNTASLQEVNAREEKTVPWVDAAEEEKKIADDYYNEME